MNIKIDEINKKIQINLDPKDYFIVKPEDDYDGNFALAHRIDMSYSGKPDQVGTKLIYLTAEEAEKLKGLVDEIL